MEFPSSRKSCSRSLNLTPGTCPLLTDLTGPKARQISVAAVEVSNQRKRCAPRLPCSRALWGPCPIPINVQISCPTADAAHPFLQNSSSLQQAATAWVSQLPLLMSIYGTKNLHHLQTSWRCCAESVVGLSSFASNNKE